MLIVLLASFISSQPYLNSNFTWEQNFSSVVGSSLALGDIDNDGDLDVALTGENDLDELTFKIYINNGTSFEENLTWEQNLTGIREGSISFSNIDGDDDIDLITIGCNTGEVEESCSSYSTKIYINNGTSFEENLTWEQNFSSVGYNTLAVGDLDNDGDLDIAMSGGTNDFSIYLNNGTVFVENNRFSQNIRTDLNNNTLTRGGIIFGDMDWDGDLDMIISGLAGASLTRIYINNGTSLNRDTNWDSNLEGLQFSSLSFGDFDNDGLTDFVIIGRSPDSTIIYKNNGSTFIANQSQATGTMAGIYDGGVSWGDYDNDGDLDLSESGQAGENRIYINNNTLFEDLSNEENVTNLDPLKSIVTWGDIDNDGDLDLFFSGWLNSLIKIYINNITNPNEPPTPPISFSSSYNNREVRLGWLNGSDNETTQLGLYYNLMVGNSSSNNNSIISGVYGGSSNPTAGYFGNMMQRKNFTLKTDRLLPSTNYTWYVQTIDTGLKAGNWSSIQSFVTPSDMIRPNITLNSPVDNFNSSSYIITFNTTVFDNINVTNVSLFGNWTGSFALNQTNVSGINNTDYIFTINLTGYNDGNYIWQMVAKDNATNIENSSLRTFTLDTNGPAISISNPPFNNSNTSNTKLDINFTASDSGVGIESCWYSNDTMTKNTSLTCGTNLTGITWAEGNHNVTVFVNDSSGNENHTSTSFNIDTTNPTILIFSPSNNTNTSDTNLDINFTASDSNLESCWYSNDTMTKNTTLSNCNNLTTISWAEQQHNITIFVNDSSGNEAKNSTSFTIDTTGPSISITFPANNTNTTNQLIDVNYTVSDSRVSVESCWYSNGTHAVNTSIACGTNLTNLNWNDQTIHNVTVYSNDSLGNENQNSVIFTVNTTDTTKPVVNLIEPSDSQSYTSNSQNVTFNYNVTELNQIINCSLTINSNINLTNSFVSKSILQNFTQTFTPASYTWNVQCTDDNNNIGNGSSRSFTVSAPSSGGGGGGGGGSSSSTTAEAIEEYDIDFSEPNMSSGSLEVAGGDIKTFSFNGEITHKITVLELTSISTRLLIESEPFTVVLILNEVKKIDFNKDGINDLEVELASINGGKANIELRTLEGADILSLEELEEAVRKEALFDLKVSISEKFRGVFPGEEVTAEIEVFNVNNIGQVDVFLEYYISDLSNKTILTKSSDSFAVEAVTSFVRSLEIPEETKPGVYIFNANITYKNFTTYGGDEFTVKRMGMIFTKTRYGEILLLVVIVIGIVVFFYVRSLKKREEKMEKAIKLVKEKMGSKLVLARKKKR